MRWLAAAATDAIAQLDEEEKAIPPDPTDSKLVDPSEVHHKFAEAIHRYSDVPIQDQLLAILTKHKVRVSKVINDWDIDGNRHISRKEFKQVLMFMGCEDITREESNEIFSMFDEDGAGAVDFMELERKLHSFDGRGASPLRREPAAT